jgi:hypothetical protein
MDFFDEEDDETFASPEELAVWLSEFMAQTSDAEVMYRNHFCTMIANRVYDEFGHEGLCELMIAMDKKAGWISDIIIENNDLDEILFKKYGVYDHNIVSKARKTEAVQEMNTKIWKLRRKYAKAIVDELMVAPSDPTPIDPLLEEQETQKPTDSDNGGTSTE